MIALSTVRAWRGRGKAAATALLIASLTALFIASPAAAEEKKLNNADEETIYLLGTSLGRSLVGFHLSKEELAIVLLGIEDEVSGNMPLVDVPQARERVQELYSKRAAAAAEAESAESVAFLERQAKLEGAKRTESGLIITELVVGSGDSPSAEDVVRVHYRGTLRDGKVFDSSIDRGEPAEFPLNRVIPCWTEGVAMMKPGGKSRLVCPPEIAYGDRGSPPAIPGGAALVFEVELLEVKPAKTNELN